MTLKLRLGLISFVVVTISSLFITGSTRAQRAGAADASQGKFRLIRSISGPRGHEAGARFVVDDARTVFRIPDDRQVIVYLEWEGPPGRHQFEGSWKNPAGKVVAVSDFTLEVRQKRCAGYFTLLLAETTETGDWTLEARVDGDAAGEHRFQIVSAKDAPAVTDVKPASAGPPPVQARQPLTESQIHELANAATVLVEKLDARGSRVDVGSGFFVDSDVVLTAFQVIDGATKLRVSLPDGRRVETEQLLSWDKRQDWAFLKVDSGQKRFINIQPDVDSSIGSRVYALAVSADGARVIVRCDIVGKNTFPQAGERINLNCSHPDVTGSPLLNEYGDLVGIVGGSLIPGWASTKSLMGMYYSGAPLANSTPGLLAVPVNPSSKPSAAKSPTPLQQLSSDGTFTPVLSRSENILYGVLAKRVEMKPVPRPIDETTEFRSREGTLVVFIAWQPKEKIKASAMFRIYDLSGRTLFESKPSKLDLKPGKSQSDSVWQANISSLKPAIYRLDVFLDSTPVWRAFFKVRD